MSEENINSALRDSIKFPLTAKAKLVYNTVNKLDKEWENKERCDALELQNKTLDNIKKRIIQRKREFLCHQNERFKSKLRKKQEIENKLLEQHKVNLRNEKFRHEVSDKLMQYNKTQNSKMKNQKDRMMNIIQKIVSEYEWKEKQQIKKPSKWKPRKKYIPTPEISITEESEEETEDTEFIVEEEIIELVPVLEDQKPKAPVKEKNEVQLKAKLDTKPNKKEKEDFVMPEVPVTNPRLKISPDDVQNMLELVSPIHEHEQFIDEENIFFREKVLSYPINKNFGCVPNEILFKDFENGKNYKKVLHIYNYSSEIQTCKYFDIKSNDDFASVFLLLEEVGVQRVIPGRYFPMTLNFNPRGIKLLEGEFIFVTQKPGLPEIRQFRIPYKCELAAVNLKVHPKNIIFKSLPIWEVENQTEPIFRTIKVENEMKQDCQLVIRKIRCDTNETRESFDLDQNNIFIDIINECIESVSNIFHFSSYIHTIPAKSCVEIKVFWRNSPYVGAFVEIFEFEFISITNYKCDILQTDRILIQSEGTGKFIETKIEYLDYNICVINSVYQQQFKVYNYGNMPVKIGFQYPKQLKQYFTMVPQTFYLKPYNHETVCLRFIPRLELIYTDMKYFDQHSKILNCPVKVIVLNPQINNMPPTMFSVFAIISEPDFIKLQFIEDSDEFHFSSVLNFGKVTTHETVKANIEIKNISPVCYEFGFFNLPEIITIEPNYGFGLLEAGETKLLQISLNPVALDLITDELVHSNGPLNVSYNVTCTTLFKLGGLRVKNENIRKTIKSQEDLEKKFDEQYGNAIDDYISGENSSDSLSLTAPHGSEILSEKEEITELTKMISIVINATLLDYWTEISHQYIIFPDTPLGSYTTVDILFSAINNSTFDQCVCGFSSKSKIPDYTCHFEVTGGSDEITIQPYCGDLKKGESVHLIVIAKPSAKQHILEETATLFKAQRLQTTKGKGKPKELDKKLSLHGCDYYPAEKEIARNIQPYTIKTKFYFTVTFPEELNKENEILCLSAECRVIRPDFILNIETQQINFGKTAIDTRPKQIITLENISRKIINPKISPLNPIGIFLCETQIKNDLEKEHILKIPITFAPTDTILYREYFEIKSGNTVQTIMVCGEGVEPKFQFAPKFSVCRLDVKGNKPVDFVFQINNLCEAQLVLQFKKICELTGKTVPKPNSKLEVPTSKAGKGAKPQKKLSDDLTEDEEYSINNFFQIYEDESQFKLMCGVDDEVILQPFEKGKIKLRFEPPASRDGKKAPPIEKGVQFLAKYNILLGNIILCKEFIMIVQCT